MNNTDSKKAWICPLAHDRILIAHCPLPFDDLYDYGDLPPEGMELEDVEFIWWSVASRVSKRELRKTLTKVAKDNSRTFDSMSYCKISDANGRGRYPRGVILVIKQVLKPYRAIGFVENGLSIQMEIWHAMTKEALNWLPVKMVPKHLRGIMLEADVGL